MASSRSSLAGALVALSLLVAAACGGADDEVARAGDDAAPAVQVATSVAPITSIVATVAGERARVRGLVPEGTDSHTFEPPPSAAEALATADVVFINGLGLEEPLRRLAETVADDAVLVGLGDEALQREEWVFDFSFPREGGVPNPHAWTDPGMGLRYVDVVERHLARVDPEGAEEYAANADLLRERTEELDRAMRTALATVPPDHRKLLTYHDSFPYFARSYGWEVIGAIQVAELRDPSPREVARLIEQVRETGVPAIFGSEVFPSPVLEQIGRETGVRYVDSLRDDDLPGEPGDPGHSWLGLLRFDYATITEALGGDATALRELDVSVPVPDRARYPQ